MPKIGNGIWGTGDCFDLMAKLPDASVDMVLCDLPYGTTQCPWDSVIPFDNLWNAYTRVCKPNAVIALTAQMPFSAALVTSNYRDFRHNFVWDKASPTGHLNAKKKPMLRHEDVFIFSRAKHGNFTYNPIMRTGKYRNKSPKRSTDGCVGRAYGVVEHKGDNFNDQYYPTSVIEISNGNRLGLIHPTQKPVALFEYLIRTYTDEGMTVLDNTAGSGTTAIAAENANRRWICIERDEEYAAKAMERIRAHVGA